MKNEMQDFLAYLKVERRYSPETIHAYERDIQHFCDYLTEVPIMSWNDVSVVDVRIYLGVLHRENYNRSSISRFLSSLRSFIIFGRTKRVESNPLRQSVIKRVKCVFQSFSMKMKLKIYQFY